MCPSKKGRFSIPRGHLANHLPALNDTFRAELPSLPPGDPDALPRYVVVTTALYAAATVTYGPPAPRQPVLSAVRVHVPNLRRYSVTHPD